MGGQVRKGEKATHVLFYKFDDAKEKPQPGAPDTPATSPEGTAEKAHTRAPMVRCYAVFNVEQADGLNLERQGDDREKPPEWKAHQTAERVIHESGVNMIHQRGDRAFYNMQTDRVTLPEREQFASANGYYQAALHELGHANHRRRVPVVGVLHRDAHHGARLQVHRMLRGVRQVRPSVLHLRDLRVRILGMRLIVRRSTSPDKSLGMRD